MIRYLVFIIMISTGDYSVKDIKALLKFFKIGTRISSTMNHPNGTYMTLEYIILKPIREGYVIQLLHQYGNYNGRYTSSRFDKMTLTRYVHKDYMINFSIA